ncbi:hypothetical protein V5O48_010361 [Marasmius crinis-equi]|uniref:G domain-containing protein n=1 Tax=Marasmius crinis-equi TaxID=585013 RepID=A0ABR3F8Q4_9AGAR
MAAEVTLPAGSEPAAGPQAQSYISGRASSGKCRIRAISYTATIEDHRGWAFSFPCVSCVLVRSLRPETADPASNWFSAIHEHRKHPRVSPLNSSRALKGLGQSSNICSGDQRWNKKTMNLVLIGETGSGKTAMLDLLANFCENPGSSTSLHQYRRKHATSNEKGGTRRPKKYQFVCPGPGRRTVNILDTPGLAGVHDSSPKGKAQKDAITKAITGAIKELSVIDAIIVVVNGTITRLGAPTLSILTMITDDLFASHHPNTDNICFIFTMTADETFLNFDITALPGRFASARYWCIDNPFVLQTKKPKRQGGRQQGPQGVSSRTLTSSRRAESTRSSSGAHSSGGQQQRTRSRSGDPARTSDQSTTTSDTLTKVFEYLDTVQPAEAAGVNAGDRPKKHKAFCCVVM